jgi:hypothetical protein
MCGRGIASGAISYDELGVSAFALALMDFD